MQKKRPRIYLFNCNIFYMKIIFWRTQGRRVLYMLILFIVIYLVSSPVKGNSEVKENETEASPPQANTNSTGKFQ